MNRGQRQSPCVAELRCCTQGIIHKSGTLTRGEASLLCPPVFMLYCSGGSNRESIGTHTHVVDEAMGYIYSREGND